MPHRRLSLWPGLSWPPLEEGQGPAFPLESPGTFLFATARQGLYIGAGVLGLGTGDEVLVPAYHHGSEIEALRRRGATCRFYDLDASLSPADGIDSIVGPRTRALLLIHYFGIPQHSERWRSWCDERDLLLLEDVAQGYLGSAGGSPLGSLGDLSIFCPYKTIGIPRIGLLHLRLHGGVRAADSGGLGLGEVVRLAAKRALARSAWLGSLGLWLQSHGRRHGDFDDQALGEIRGPSRSARILLARHRGDHPARVRRGNHRRLLQELRTLVHPAFKEIADGASPLVFPIVTDDSTRLVAVLRGRGILASPFWPQPHRELPIDQFPVARDLRERIVALPVHQLLQEEDLATIAATTRSAVGLDANSA